MKTWSNVAARAANLVEDFVSSDTRMGELFRQIFDWAYAKATEGVPGLDSAAALAARFAARHRDTDDAIAALIRWQSAVAGAAGLIAGAGGFVTLPVALPANLASALYLQLRLVAAIAHLRGHDTASDEVRALALACLAGSQAADTLRDAGVRLAMRVSRDAAGWVAPVLYKRLHHAGAASAVMATSRFTRFMPLVGGIVAGGFDAAMTQLIGHTADRVFRAAAKPPVIDAEPEVVE
jgi:EcsC family protein